MKASVLFYVYVFIVLVEVVNGESASFYLPIDGSTTLEPNATHPFYQTRLRVIDGAITPLPLLREYTPTTTFKLQNWTLNEVQFTSRFLVLGYHQRLNDTFIRQAVVVGCGVHNGMCSTLVMLAEIPMANFVPADPVSPGTTTMPHTAISISVDSQWLAILYDTKTLNLYRLNETKPLNESYSLYQQLNQDVSSMFAVSMSRKANDYTKLDEGRPLGLISGFMWSYPFLVWDGHETGRFFSNWKQQFWLLEWQRTTQTWSLVECKTCFGSSPDPASSILTKSFVLMAESNAIVSCLEVLQGGIKVVESVFIYMGNASIVIEQDKVDSCDPVNYQTIDPTSIAFLMQRFAAGSAAVQFPDRPLILVSRGTQGAPISVHALEYDAANLTPGFVKVAPNIMWNGLDNSIGYRSFAAQPDALLFSMNNANIIYGKANPGYITKYPSILQTEIPCPIGLYKPTPDLSPCLPCPAQTYQSRIGQSTCLPCPEDMYCSIGTANPTPLELSDKSTELEFLAHPTQSTVQQRMVASVFNPFSSSSSKEQFFTLLGTAIAGLAIILCIAYLQYQGKFPRLIDYLLKLDLFKEPALSKSRKKIIDQGSFTGLFFTLLGGLAMLMCLWFVVSFHGNFVSFLVVARGNTPAWTPNDNIGRNNENIVRVETTEGIKNQNRKLIDNIQRFLQYRVTITLLDVRSLDQPDLVTLSPNGSIAGQSTICQINPSAISAKIAGCYTNAGRECVAEEPIPPWRLAADGRNDCEITLVIEGPHTLSDSHQIQIEFMLPLFYTSMIVRLETSCPLCNVSVAPFSLLHTFRPEDQGISSSPVYLAVGSTFVIRESVIMGETDPIQQAYASVSTSALHSAPATSTRQWFQMSAWNPTLITISISQTPFWIVQRATLAATQTELIIVLLLTAVTLFSGLRVVVKAVSKIFEKIAKCHRRCQKRKVLHDSFETTALLISSEGEDIQ